MIRLLESENNYGLTKDDFDELRDYGITRKNVRNAYNMAHKILDKYNIEVSLVGLYGFGNEDIPEDVMLNIYKSIDWDEDDSDIDEDSGEINYVFANKEYEPAGEFGFLNLSNEGYGNSFVVSFNEL